MGHPTLHVHRMETLLRGPLLDETLIELRPLGPDDYPAVIALADDLTGAERYVRDSPRAQVNSAGGRGHPASGP